MTEGEADRLPVKVGLMTDNGHPLVGELDFLGNRIDRGTGTIRARAIVQNYDDRLAPGLFVRVKLVTAEPTQTVLIDEQAIAVDQGRRYVLVLGAENKAEYRPIELGPMIDGMRVVSAGLKSGEKSSSRARSPRNGSRSADSADALQPAGRSCPGCSRCSGGASMNIPRFS